MKYFIPCGWSYWHVSMSEVRVDHTWFTRSIYKETVKGKLFLCISAPLDQFFTLINFMHFFFNFYFFNFFTFLYIPIDFNDCQENIYYFYSVQFKNVLILIKITPKLCEMLKRFKNPFAGIFSPHNYVLWNFIVPLIIRENS